MNTHGSTRQGSTRQGLSLIEVLISIGVMSIGILGTAALLPIGGAEIAEASRLERGAAIGRAAYRDSIVRGILRPENLVNPDNPVPPVQNPWKDLGGNAMAYPTDRGNSVCIDPMYWAQNFMIPPNAGNARFAQFPSLIDQDSSLAIAPNPPPRMTRATLASYNSNGWLSRGEAESMFRWHDDLVFQPFEEDEFTNRALLPARPRQIFAADAGAMSGATRQYAGDFSWFVTLTPAETEDPDASAATSRQYYTASFVVCHKRDLAAPQFDRTDRTRPPGEKIVLAAFETNQLKALGGGTLSLRVPDTVNTTDPEDVDLPKLRANQWILLAGWTTTPTPQQSAMAVAGTPFYLRPVFKWYRVASVLDKPTYVTNPAPAGWNQKISVVGPDWDTLTVSANPGSTPMLYAILIDGVVGVYEKTIALQR